VGVISKTNGPKYFWFLNNDTEVAGNALLPLIAKMTSNPKIGICGSSILYASDRQTVQAYGGAYYSLRTGRGWAFGMGTRYDPKVSDHLAEAQINFVSGAAMFVRATSLAEIGSMCEDYFLYNEEIDLAKRGEGIFTLGVATSSIVYHMVGASIGSEKGEGVGSRLATFYQARSKLLFAKKHTLRYLLLVWLVMLARAFKFTSSPLTRGNALVLLSVLAGRRKVDARWFTERSRESVAPAGEKTDHK
jgi:GT2 family glycosyltransferase